MLQLTSFAKLYLYYLYANITHMQILLFRRKGEEGRKYIDQDSRF